MIYLYVFLASLCIFGILSKQLSASFLQQTNTLVTQGSNLATQNNILRNEINILQAEIDNISQIKYNVIIPNYVFESTCRSEENYDKLDEYIEETLR